MNFITILKEKVFKRYSLNVSLDQETNQYKIVNYFDEPLNEKFYTDLEKDLSLPIPDKNFTFTFSIQEFKGFKNSALQSFIKHNPSKEDFNNVFHSFYKSIPAVDLFNALHIKTDAYGNSFKSIYEPYIIYLLNQNFTHQNFFSDDFLSILRFNYPINEKSYPELKESLYNFLSNHVDHIKSNFSNKSEESEENIKNLKIFENSLYNRIDKFIKPHDMKIFSKFWPHILINNNNNNMLTKVDNTFVFNLNYDYLSHTFSEITNETIAKDTSIFINNVINNNFEEYLNSSIIHKGNDFSTFVLKFNKDIEQKNIPEIFEDIINLQIKTQQIKTYYLKSEFQVIWQTELELINKKLYCISLSNKLPSKNISEKKLKI